MVANQLEGKKKYGGKEKLPPLSPAFFSTSIKQVAAEHANFWIITDARHLKLTYAFEACNRYMRIISPPAIS